MFSLLKLERDWNEFDISGSFELIQICYKRQTWSVEEEMCFRGTMISESCNNGFENLQPKVSHNPSLVPVSLSMVWDLRTSGAAVD